MPSTSSDQSVADCRSWERVKEFMDTTLPQILSSDHPRPRPSDVTQPQLPDAAAAAAASEQDSTESSVSHGDTAIRLLRSILGAVPLEEVSAMLATRNSSLSCCSAAAPACVSPAAAASFLDELHSTELFSVVHAHLTGPTDVLATDILATDSLSAMEPQPKQAAVAGLQTNLHQTDRAHAKPPVGRDCHVGSLDSQYVNTGSAEEATNRQNGDLQADACSATAPAADDLSKSGDAAAAVTQQPACTNEACSGVTPACNDRTDAIEVSAPPILSCCCQKPDAPQCTGLALEQQHLSRHNSPEVLQSSAAVSTGLPADSSDGNVLTRLATGHEKGHRPEALCMLLLLIPETVWRLVPVIQVGFVDSSCSGIYEQCIGSKTHSQPEETIVACCADMHICSIPLGCKCCQHNLPCSKHHCKCVNICKAVYPPQTKVER